MMPLATVERVAARIGEPITSDEDIALANAVLEEASNWVRAYGLDWPNPELAPAVAVSITVSAAARGYQNPGGFESERAEVVTLGRAEDYAKGTELTQAEINMLERISGRRKGVIRSIRLQRPHLMGGDRPLQRRLAPNYEHPARGFPMPYYPGEVDPDA